MKRELKGIVVAATAGVLVLAGCGNSDSDDTTKPQSGSAGSQDCAMSTSVADLTMFPLVSILDTGYAIDSDRTQSTSKELMRTLLKDDELRATTISLYDEQAPLDQAIKDKKSDEVLASRDRIVALAKKVVERCGDKAAKTSESISKVTSDKFPTTIQFGAPTVAPPEPTEAALPPVSDAKFTPADTTLKLGQTATIPTSDDASAVEVTVTDIESADIGEIRKAMSSESADEVTSAYYVRYKVKVVAGQPSMHNISSPKLLTGDTKAKTGTFNFGTDSCPEKQSTDEETGVVTACTIVGIKGSGEAKGVLVRIDGSENPLYAKGIPFVKWEK